MGFSKKTYESEVAIEVRHGWYPETTFVFYFPKHLPQSALDAEKAFLSLDDKEGAEKSRVALINVVAEMSLRAPSGFDDFPMSAVTGDLQDRVRDYFDDATKPELEQIVSAAWAAYKQGARPVGYLKSAQDRRAGGGDVSGVSVEASS